MNLRFPTLVASLSIAGLLGWMASVVPEVESPTYATVEEPATILLQERSGGSEVPCAVPLRWRIARIDPAFELDIADAEARVREAANLWEEAAGRSLFIHDPRRGFPIRLVYDVRQQDLAEQQAGQRVIDQLESRIAADRAALGARGERGAAAAAAYAERASVLQRRVSEHNATVRRWNQAGGAPDSLRVELEAIGEALRLEREHLDADRPALEAEQASLKAGEEELNQLIREHQRLVAELTSALPPSSVEAGEYREAVRRVDGRVDSVSREIRLYRFANPTDLRLIAAHELGHALGLGHTQDPAGVMHQSADANQPAARLAPTDVALLESVCPAL